MIAQGMSNKGISRQLFLSPKSVHNNTSNIFLKQRVVDRAQAIVRTHEAGARNKTRRPPVRSGPRPRRAAGGWTARAKLDKDAAVLRVVRDHPTTL